MPYSSYSCTDDFELFQIDVKTAFINGELDEEIYMDQHVGCIT